jgi:hypothetical protein
MNTEKFQNACNPMVTIRVLLAALVPAQRYTRRYA